MTVSFAALALECFRRYGKGIDPKARLNFCDCAVYALAKAMRAPLLFKGNDFTETDIECCLWSASRSALDKALPHAKSLDNVFDLAVPPPDASPFASEGQWS